MGARCRMHERPHQAHAPSSVRFGCFLALDWVSAPPFFDTNSAFRRLVCASPYQRISESVPSCQVPMAGLYTVLLGFAMRCVAPATDSIMANTRTKQSRSARTGAASRRASRRWSSSTPVGSVSLSRRQRHVLGASAHLAHGGQPGCTRKGTEARVRTATSSNPDASR